MKKKNKFILVMLCLAIILGYVKCSSDNGRNAESKQASVSTTKEATPAQKLAALDANSDKIIDINDIRVKEIEKHLSSLSYIFNEPENVIANSTYIATQQLARKRVSYTNIKLLESVDKDDDGAIKKSGMKYEEYISAIVTLTAQ